MTPLEASSWVRVAHVRVIRVSLLEVRLVVFIFVFFYRDVFRCFANERRPFPSFLLGDFPALL